MTDPEIDRLLALEAEATPGLDNIAPTGRIEDYHFAVAARSALKPLALEVRRLRQEVANADKALHRLVDERDTVAKALKSVRAAVWDRHYGKGLSKEYAQSVESEIKAALEGL